MVAEVELDGWALVLGASSGFGEAAALAFAKAGMDIAGVHFDRRGTMDNVERIVGAIRGMGRRAEFFNVNAADARNRTKVLDELKEKIGGDRVRVLLHSLAFGSLRPLYSPVAEEQATQQQIEMTLDVMASSLVYWTQDVVQREMMGQGGRIFAMTSTGSWSVWESYGVVSAAKAALEAYVRQLAFELAPRGISVNAICAGVTATPALLKIPGHEDMMAVAKRKNPHHRLTTPEDVAKAMVALAHPSTYWLTGNVLNVDGGEAIGG